MNINSIVFKILNFTKLFKSFYGNQEHNKKKKPNTVFK